MDNHYSTLGVNRSATPDEIKSAYLRLAKIYHPDANCGDKGTESRFKDVGAAYAILSNALTRREYGSALDAEDLLARANTTRATAREDECAAKIIPPAPGQMPKFKGIFSPGEVITLEEAFSGKVIEMDFTADVRCKSCEGSGNVPAGHSSCNTCGGTGSYWTSKETSAFEFTAKPCGTCGGRGYIAVTAGCRNCGGRGIIRGDIYGDIIVPPGVPDTFSLVWETIDGAKVSTPFSVSPNKKFRRSGNDLLATRRLSLSSAVKGINLKIKGIDGAKLRVKVPPNTIPGTVLRVRAHGMSCFDRPGRGDLLIALDN